MAPEAKLDFDLIVIGGGLVGCALALALHDSGLTIALVESKNPVPLLSMENPIAWDNRVYAVNLSSADFLRHIGVWQQLDQTRLTAVHDILVWGDENAQLNFQAYDAGQAELAYIVENRLLQDAMWETLAQQSNVTLFCPSDWTAIDWEKYSVNLTLHDTRSLTAKLLVAADGAFSKVRDHAQIGCETIAYDQLGIVANFNTSNPHHYAARQWFTKDGVLAFLPLPENRISMVWSVDQQRGQKIMELDEEQLCATVEMECDSAMGPMELISPVQTFPLHLVKVKRLIKDRLALIGDAAHNIHPLAGQGVNLGFADARKLANVISTKGRENDCGNYFLLRRYERARWADIKSMQFTTHALQKLFNNSSPLLKTMRNAGLAITNNQRWLKHRLMQHAIN